LGLILGLVLSLIARLARARAFRLATAAEPRPRAAGRL